MLIVLYDVSLLVNKVCNLTRSIGTLSVFLHGVTLVFRFRVCVSVFSDRVAIGCELRLSTRDFLAPVYAVVSTRSYTKVSSYIFILGLFYLSFLHSRFFVSTVTFL